MEQRNKREKGTRVEEELVKQKVQKRKVRVLSSKGVAEARMINGSNRSLRVVMREWC